MKNFYIGDFKKDSQEGQNRNWILGTFMDDAARKTEAVEIKYWEFPVGDTTHPTKISTTIECTIILEGKIEGIIDDAEIELSQGQYVVIPPHTKNNLMLRVIKLAKGFTIKAPSDPKAKKIIN